MVAFLKMPVFYKNVFLGGPDGVLGRKSNGRDQVALQQIQQPFRALSDCSVYVMHRRSAFQ